MKQIRKRLTYANVMSSIAVFLVLGGAAVAATQLPKNSVGSKQLKKNAVTAVKIKKNAVTAAKIKSNAVTTAKVKNGAITGAKVDVASLGTVPSAATAQNLAGQTPFLVRLGIGQSQLLAANGAVSFTAECVRSEGDDIARIVYDTTVPGAVAGGEDDYEGTIPSEFLNPGAPPTERELVEESDTEGDTYVYADIDEGFVLGPEGKLLTTNSEGIVLGLNYGQPGCLFGGVINAVG